MPSLHQPKFFDSDPIRSLAARGLENLAENVPTELREAAKFGRIM